MLTRSVEKAFPEGMPDARHVERYLEGLHLEDLALASACQDGHDAAWEHFIGAFRPQLYRAAAAIDASGNGRELADSLYADLFGLKERDGERQSLFRYFHGRSSLGTWLRSVLAQRHVDRLRSGKRLEPLPEEGAGTTPVAPAAASPDRQRLVAAVIGAFTAALGRLTPRDRLRLACYHAQQLTLAQIGKLTGEHEATVSRHLTRTRRELRRDVDEQLQSEHAMSPAEIAEAFAEAVADPGPLDVGQLLAEPGAHKDSALDRSK